MNEDFVPFELSKKLKEKGFDWKTLESYTDKIKKKHLVSIDSGVAVVEVKDTVNTYPKPTISQVLKWLREEKNIFVLIDIRTDLSFFYEIWSIEIALHPMGCVPFQKYQSYEQAAIEGIKYVIDNFV